MEEYEQDPCIRIGQDPSHYGAYEVELEAEIPGNIDPIRAALESSGYTLVDCDQWGLTYFDDNEPYLRIDVDELDDLGNASQIVMRKGGLRECDLGQTVECLNPDFSKPQRAQRTQRVKCLLLKKL